MSDTSAPAARTCDNCGGNGDLEAVRRMYVVPETWDQAGSQTTMPDVEHWCFSCRSMYPHERVDG